MPELPFLENLKGDAMAMPFKLGISLPSIRVKAGLGSQVSTWEGAPCAKMWTTCFALAGRGDCLRASRGNQPFSEQSGQT